MAAGAGAPGCGEYNRKNALARQIYTIRRGRLLPHYHIWGCKGCLVSLAGNRRKLVARRQISTVFSQPRQRADPKAKNGHVTSKTLPRCLRATRALPRFPSLRESRTQLYDASRVDRSLARTKYKTDAIASTIPFTANSHRVAYVRIQMM